MHRPSLVASNFGNAPLPRAKLGSRLPLRSEKPLSLSRIRLPCRDWNQPEIRLKAKLQQTATIKIIKDFKPTTWLLTPEGIRTTAAGADAAVPPQSFPAPIPAAAQSAGSWSISDLARHQSDAFGDPLRPERNSRFIKAQNFNYLSEQNHLKLA